MNQNVIEANLLKLAYNEVSVCSDAAAAAWNKILEKGDEPVDMKILLEAVKAGMNANPSYCAKSCYLQRRLSLRAYDFYASMGHYNTLASFTGQMHLLCMSRMLFQSHF